MIVIKMSSGALCAQEASLASSTSRIGEAADLMTTSLGSHHFQQPSLRPHLLFMDVEMSIHVLITVSMMLLNQG